MKRAHWMTIINDRANHYYVCKTPSLLKKGYCIASAAGSVKALMRF